MLPIVFKAPIVEARSKVIVITGLVASTTAKAHLLVQSNGLNVEEKLIF